MKEKINVYDELVASVKQLASRNSDFMTNEVEICRLMNVISITQKELDQKEKFTSELNDKVKESEQSQAIHDTANLKIAEKQRLVEQLNEQLFEKDKKIEQLQKLLRAKQAQESEMTFKAGKPESEEEQKATKIQRKQKVP